MIDPFTAASPTWQRSAGRGVRLQPLIRTGRAFLRPPPIPLIVVVIAVVACILTRFLP